MSAAFGTQFMLAVGAANQPAIAEAGIADAPAGAVQAVARFIDCRIGAQGCASSSADLRLEISRGSLGATRTEYKRVIDARADHRHQTEVKACPERYSAATPERSVNPTGMSRILLTDVASRGTAAVRAYRDR
jgi:hypothetical protein